MLIRLLRIGTIILDGLIVGIALANAAESETKQERNEFWYCVFLFTLNAMVILFS